MNILYEGNGTYNCLLLSGKQLMLTESELDDITDGRVKSHDEYLQLVDEIDELKALVEELQEYKDICEEFESMIQRVK